MNRTPNAKAAHPYPSRKPWSPHWWIDPLELPTAVLILAVLLILTALLLGFGLGQAVLP